MITIQHTPAGARMNAITEPFRYKLTALTTCLRSVPGVDCDEVHASFFRFACKSLQKQTPGYVRHALRQSGASKPLDIQIFVRD